MCLHTRLNEFLLTSLPALSCLLHCRVNSLMDALVVECKCKHHCYIVVCVFCLDLF